MNRYSYIHDYKKGPYAHKFKAGDRLKHAGKTDIYVIDFVDYDKSIPLYYVLNAENKSDPLGLVHESYLNKHMFVTVPS